MYYSPYTNQQSRTDSVESAHDLLVSEGDTIYIDGHSRTQVRLILGTYYLMIPGKTRQPFDNEDQAIDALIDWYLS